MTTKSPDIAQIVLTKNVLGQYKLTTFTREGVKDDYRGGQWLTLLRLIFLLRKLKVSKP